MIKNNRKSKYKIVHPPIPPFRTFLFSSHYMSGLLLIPLRKTEILHSWNILLVRKVINLNYYIQFKGVINSMREGRWGEFKPGIFLYVMPTSPPHNGESEVAQSCPTLCDPVDYSPPGSSVHGILQARVLEWVAISFSRASSWPRDRTQVSRIAGRRFNLWATREAPSIHLLTFKNWYEDKMH